jgi:hypothetical protein
MGLKTLNNFLSILTENVISKINEGESFDLNKNKFRKINDQYIKETIIRPIVERHLIEAEMAFVDDEQDDEIEEATTTSGVGAFAYDAPAFNVDPKTQKFKNNESMERLHTSIKKLVENRLKKQLSINEAKDNLGKTLYFHLQDALKNPSLFNNPSWIETHKNLQTQGEGKENVKKANSQIVKMIKSYLNSNPELHKIKGFNEAYSLIKDNKDHNERANKFNDELNAMHKELEENPELANDEKFMEKYNDLNNKYGIRRSKGGQKIKRTSGIERDLVSMVTNIVKRVFNYIANIYKEYGLDFNKQYPYTGGRDKKPSESWDSLRGDIYEKLGFTYDMDRGVLVRTPNADKNTDLEIEKISNINDDDEFVFELGKTLGDIYTREDIEDAAEFFKKEVETAKKRLANSNLNRNSDIEMNYRY